MRRIDRAVTSEKEIDDFIMSCDCCRLGLIDDDEVYIVPLNFAYSNKNNIKTFYFHGAKIGRKIDLINKNKKAGFELDLAKSLITAEQACDFSYSYQSVIGSGRIELIHDIAEKSNALNLIMHHYTQKNDWSFPEKILTNMSVIKLTVEKLSCKKRL